MIIDTKRVGSWIARAFWPAATIIALLLAFQFVSSTIAFQQAEIELDVYKARALGAIAQEAKRHST
jgi:hypothetical protein